MDSSFNAVRMTVPSVVSCLRLTQAFRASLGNTIPRFISILSAALLLGLMSSAANALTGNAANGLNAWGACSGCHGSPSAGTANAWTTASANYSPNAHPISWYADDTVGTQGSRLAGVVAGYPITGNAGYANTSAGMGGYGVALGSAAAPTQAAADIAAYFASLFAVPGAPTIGTATPGNVSLSVAFTAPTSALTITGYTANCGGTTGTNTASPIVVTGLTNGTSYTCTVTATSNAGTSAASGASTAATPRTVPGAPTIGTVTPGNTSISVAFTAPASNGGSIITGYTANCGGTTGTGAASPVLVSGLTNGMTYTCTVTASNAAGAGAASGVSASATPVTAPSAPTITTVTPTNAAATVVFSAPASLGGATLVGYTVASSPAGGTDSNAGTTGLSHVVTGLTNGISYTFIVTVTTSAGSTPSLASGAAIPFTVPSAPTGVSAAIGNTQATVSFTSPANNGSAITGYTVTSSPGGFTGTGASSPINVTGLSNGTAYTFTVTATNAAGTGAASTASAAVTPATVPGAPTGASAAIGNTQATVSFTAPANNGSAITGYTVTSSPGGFTGAGASSPVTVTGLTNGTSYTFTVTATNAVGTGAASLASAAVTPATVPGVPTGVAATLGNTQATVSFTAPASTGGAAITGYTVTASPGGRVATGVSSPITITGLTNGTAYTFTVVANNSVGSGTTSTASGAITPQAPPTAGATSATVAFNSSANVITPSISGVTNAAGIIVTVPALHGTATASGVNNTVTYTPTVGYLGADSFSYTVTGPGGTSTAGVVSITVNPLVPVTANTTMQVQINTPQSLDLTALITGNGVGISTQAAHGVVTAAGKVVTYTPTKDYFGTDSFTYVAYNSLGTASAPATITVTITGRPDPIKDARVTGLVNIETNTVKRFGKAQVFNFQQRLESRHHAIFGGVSLAGQGGDVISSPSTGGVVPEANRSYFNSWQPGTVLAYANDPNTLLNAPDQRMENRDTTYDPLTGMLANVLIGGLTSDSLNLATVSNAVGAMQEESFSRLEVWAAGNLRFGTRSQSGVDTRFSTDGISVGADKRIDRKLTMGMGLGFARDKSTVGIDGTNSRSTGTSVAGYASYLMDAGTFTDVLLGIGKVNFDTNRYVTSVNDFARATRTGSQLFGSFSFGYEYRKDGVLWSPYGRYDFSLDHLNAGTEIGAGANALNYAKQDSRNSQLAFGMRAQSVHQTSFGVVQPHARFEYQRSVESSGQTYVSYADLLGTQYTVAPTTLNKNSVVLGLGSEFLLSDTLRFVLDYQHLGSGAQENYQSLSFRITKDLNGKNDLDSLLAESYESSSKHPAGLMVAAGFAYDDNVARASEALDKLSDTLYSLTLSKAHSFNLTPHTRLATNGFLDMERFRTYTGLNHVSAGGQVEYQYRFSGEFGSPTLGVVMRLTKDEYESALRDGSRASFGFTYRQPVTDRIHLFSAVSRNIRNGRSAVFNTQDNSIRANLDYELSAKQTLYLGGEYRVGDIISTGHPSLAILDIATVFVKDDVFISPRLYDYRMKGKTSLFSIGYNYSFGTRDSIDISWRHVQSKPDKAPDFVAPPISYTDNQISVSYLMAF